MEQNGLAIDLTQGSIPRTMLRYSIPFMFANLLQMLYNVVDMAIVGQFVGSAGMTAVSLGANVVFLWTCLMVGLGTGAQIMIAQFAGARDKESIRVTVGTSLSFIGLVSVGMGIIGIASAGPILTLMNTPAEAMSQAKAYTYICLAGAPFIGGYNAICAALRGMGDSKRPLLFIAISSVVNVILDLILVAVVGMEAEGAAIATVFSQVVSCVVGLIYLYRKREEYGIDFSRRSLRIDGQKVKSILKLGVPQGVQGAAISISFLFIAALVNEYGVDVAAGYAAGSKVEQLSNTLTAAVGTAGASMVGQNIAAGKIDRVRQIVRVSLIVCMIYTTLFVIFMRSCPELLVKIFTSEETVVESGAIFVSIVCFGLYGHALMATFNGVIMGVGFSMFAMFNSLMDGVVLRVLLSLLFSKVMGMGYTGICLGNMLAIFWPGTAGGIYYLSGRWKTRKLLARREESSGGEAAVEAEA